MSADLKLLLCLWASLTPLSLARLALLLSGHYAWLL